MEIVQLILIALEAIARVARNPALGLGEDAGRVAALVDVVAQLGRGGLAAIPELRALTAEIEEIAASGAAVDRAEWDAVTLRRRAQAEAILAATRPAG